MRHNEAGDTSDVDLVGLKFVALPFYGIVAGPHYFFEIEECMAGDYPTFETAEDALLSVESK